MCCATVIRAKTKASDGPRKASGGLETLKTRLREASKGLETLGNACRNAGNKASGSARQVTTKTVFGAKHVNLYSGPALYSAAPLKTFCFPLVFYKFSNAGLAE